jgi:hypothetical protein
MCPQFTELLCSSAFATSASVAASISAAASTFIMEETYDDKSNASNNIPHSLRASAANIHLTEVEEYLQFLMCP